VTERPPHSLAAINVTVSFGSTTLHVAGRAGLLIAWIATHAERVNAKPIGRLVAHFAHRQLKLELTESLPAIRLSE
jgi:hypothetical protein